MNFDVELFKNYHDKVDSYDNAKDDMTVNVNEETARMVGNAGYAWFAFLSM
jgi:hypothetical protein